MARAIFEKWDLDFAVIGTTTADKRLKLSMYGRIWCDIPVPPLVDQAPVYDRPCAPLIKPVPLSPLPGSGHEDLLASLLKLLSCPDLASKRWIWEQYDSLVRGQTISSPGVAGTQAHKPADAAIVRIPGNDKALAITTDCTPRYCFADPFEGAKQAVAESWRNLCAVGATPLAVTNNLNFGNPQKPPIMAQFVAGVEGIAAACKALDYPVISGNVSLYNETNGEAIFPTPAIGGVGVIADWSKATGLGFTGEQEEIFLVGDKGLHLGQTLYLRELHGREEGAPPPVDLEKEKRHGLLIRSLIAKGVITTCHDVSDGGLLVALAEMAMASGMGAEISATGDVAFWFGEDQSRYVLTTTKPQEVIELAKKDSIPLLHLGRTGGKTLKIANNASMLVSQLIYENERWLPAYMEGN